ncbi:MAG: hypothetical protein IPL49_10290 [Saprospirales bacterium]|nr:hypothetical protein [Saprospirales bacterium]
MEDETPLFGYPVRDARLGIKALREAFPFIRKHRLWTGVFSYGWLSRFFLVIGIIAGLNFFGILIKWIGTLRSVDDPLSYGASVLDLYSSLFDGGFFLFSLGGMKYIVLILTEVLLFHVVRRALEILKGGGEDTSLKAFLHAQVRMVKISALAWASEMVLSVGISVSMGIMDADWLKSPLNWIVQCFFLGAVVMDNYFERYQMPIKSSLILSRQAAGLAFVVGVTTYVLLSIPLIGAVLAPFFASITATLALFEMDAKGWLLLPTTQPPN